MTSDDVCRTFTQKLPGSKSYTNRALVLAAAVPGTTRITGALDCDDTRLLAKALDSFGGIEIDWDGHDVLVSRLEDVLVPPAEPLDVGHGGTPARFLLAFAGQATGPTTITGSARLRERPFGGLLQALRDGGAAVEGDHLPVTLRGPMTSYQWLVDASESSQHASALLLGAVARPVGSKTRVRIEGLTGSAQYLEMTVQSMLDAGVAVSGDGGAWDVVAPEVIADEIRIEGDASAATYVLGAGAITGEAVRAAGVGNSSLQGDVGFGAVLQRMGCEVEVADSSIRLSGRVARGVDVDMSQMPDAVPTLAVVAAFVDGETRMSGIANLRFKESDRISDTASNLAAIGAQVDQGNDYLIVKGSPQDLHGGVIDTKDDHRLAMAFALAGLRLDGVTVNDPDVVTKSWPSYWNFLDRFRRHETSHGQLSAK